MMYLTHGLRRSAALFPNRVSTVCCGRRRTWAEVRDRVSRLAGGLAALGVNPGDRVSILALNSDRYVEFYFAAAWAGAVVVPLNTRWAIAEHVHALTDSGAEVLIIDDAFAPVISDIKASVGLRAVIYAGDGDVPADSVAFETLAAESQPLDDRCGQGRDLAAIFYTGGTTGRAKGVMLSHEGLVTNFLLSQVTTPRNITQIYLHAAPMFHLADATMVYGITFVGGTHVIIPSFTPAAFMGAVSAEQVSDLLLVPTMMGMLCDHVEAEGGDLGSVTSLTYGASAVSETLLRRVMNILPNAQMKQAYGQTELGPGATILLPEYHQAGPDGRSLLRSVGQPMVGIDIRVADPELHDLPPGRVGEVLVRSPTAMLGYWNQPDLTTQTIVEGWLRTGDAGYLDDEGFLYLVDRVKDMIVSGGENVYSAEVENALSSHPAVGECAVIGVPDDKWGERVHAIIRLRPGHAALTEEIIGHCKERIATYKCPRSVEIREDPFPMSGAGKILKSELRKYYWNNFDRNIA